MDDVARLWAFLPIGYLTTIVIETLVLLPGLSLHHPMSRRLISGVWLTACTYPIVVLVMPIVFGADLSSSRYWTYVLIAEIFAPAAECILFWYVFHRDKAWRAASRRRDRVRDYAAIIIANVASFGAGVLWFASTQS